MTPSPSPTSGPSVPAFAPGEAYQLLVEGIVDCALYLLDPEGRVATWNPGAERIKGYCPAEVLGRSFAIFYPAEDIEAGLPGRALTHALEHGRFEDEGYRVRKDGSRFWANVALTALRDEAGQLRGFAKITRDLTQRKLAEETARQAEEKFHRLVDSVTDYAVFLLDPEGNVETWNEGAHRAKGYVEAEIVGRHFSTFYPPEDRAKGRPVAILDTVRREGRFEEEGFRVRKDGSRFWANVVITALRSHTGDVVGFAKVTRDLSARREAEEVQRALQAEQTARVIAEQVAARAKEANRIKDEFLATVSHELRTPLNAIVGWASLLRKEPLEGSIAHAVDVIDRNARAQARIVDDILDVSRIITGKLRIERNPADLVAVVSNALEIVRPAAEAKGITLSFDPHDARVEVLGDVERLQQVVWNLLSNAVKFTARGGTVMVSTSRTSEHVSLAVTDDGRGMEPAFVARAFDRFLQEDATISRRVGGLGLGLAIVRHIVELHGGTAAAESDGLGRGATFRIQLPVDPAPPAPPSAGDPPPSSIAEETVRPGGLSGCRIVLVEDEDDSRALLALMLSRAGARVFEASTAAEGFAAVEAHRPHLLLSDLGLPGEDGYSLMRRVRVLPKGEGGELPAVALSAYTRAADKEASVEAGFDVHIGKPFAIEEVLETVQRLLEHGREAR